MCYNLNRDLGGVRLIKIKEFSGTFDNPDIGKLIDDFLTNTFTAGREMIIDIKYSVENVIKSVDGKTVRRTVSSAVLVYTVEEGTVLATEKFNGNDFLLEFRAVELKGNFQENSIGERLEGFLGEVSSDEYVYVDTLYDTISQKVRDDVLILSNALFIYARRVNA